jgi:hypothetical protein
MRALRFAWAFSLLLTIRAGAEEAVQFGDPLLKAAVERELWITDPTPTDMLDLTSLVYVPDPMREQERISSLTGLEYAVHLETLNVRFNRITNVSVLSGLTELKVLNLSQNHVTDISPLAGLVNLYDLNLHGNGISDITPLAGLTNLVTLTLRFNLVSDVSVLAGLPNLRDLDLRLNRIEDISPLCALTSLSFLNIRINPLPDDAYDILIPQIIANNPGITVSYDSHGEQWLTVLSAPGGTVVEPGEGEFPFDYDMHVRLLAQPRPGFAFTGWSGTYVSPQNPLFLTMDQSHEMRANFVSLLDTLYVDDDAPADPGPGDAAVSDPNEDGSPAHPFDRIQEAIEVAAAGVTILVQPGTYGENLDLLGKSLDLRGVDPAAPAGGPCAVLKGAGSGPLVRFSGTGAKGTLQGFVLTRGQGQPAAALSCDRASPTITHCLFVGNRTADPNGAVIYCRDSQAVLANCTIADNYGGARGAALALWDSDVTVTNSIFWGNRPREILQLGTSEPSIRYCTVPGWWADLGNIDADPLFARRGNWIDPQHPEATLDPQDVRAVWAAGDYHLQSQTGRWNPDTQTWVRDDVTSPCIDRGGKSSPVGNEPAPNGGIVNMGAYGGTGEASKSPATPPLPE